MSNPGVAGEGQDKSDQQYHWELWQQRRRRRKTSSKKQLVSRAKQQPCTSITLHDTFLGSQTHYDLKFSRATFHGGREQITTNSPFLSFYHNLTNWVSWNNLDEVQRTRIHLTSVSGFNSLATYSAISTSGYTVMSWIHPVNCGSEFSPFPTL